MSLRYFENPKPDYEIEVGNPQIPEAKLKHFLNELLSMLNLLKPVEKNGGDGLYLGTAGVSYMFYHLSKNPSLGDKKNEFLTKAVEYLKPALAVSKQKTKNINDIPSLLLGNAGVYAVAAAIYHALGDKTQSQTFQQMFYNAAPICKDPNFLSCGSDELLVGRAGYILGALWMAKETGTPLQTKEIYDICKVAVKSGRDYAVRHHSPCPLMYAYYQVEYLGAAHGLGSVLQALLSVPGFLELNATDTADIKRCVDYLLSVQSKEGNFPTATDEIGQDNNLVHWCHGAPGIVYLMAKAYLVFREQKYLDSCKLMSDLIWEKGLLKKGPGICHGVAGNAYAFLLLYRLTEDPKYIYRAIRFFQFLQSQEFKSKARVPDYPYSLFEGIAGTACFVADLTNPTQACFPFSDVF